MSVVDFEFNKMCREVLDHGVEYENKNRGVKRLQIPSYTFRHCFDNGFPILSLKKVPWKWTAVELMWFLRGDTDVRYLNDNGVNFWNKDAWNFHKKHGGTLTFEEFSEKGEGSVGRNYSAQWRNFNGVDQITELIKGMKEDIMSSRLKVNAWNPAELDMTALPPCHSEFQVIGVPLKDGGFGFELHWNQRSTDVYLGAPVNIASYGLLAKMLEIITGYKAFAIEGTFKCVHFYDNQYEAAEQMVGNDTHSNGPSFEYVGVPYDESKGLDNWLASISPLDFKLDSYAPQDSAKVDMLAPKSI